MKSAGSISASLLHGPQLLGEPELSFSVSAKLLRFAADPQCKSSPTSELDPRKCVLKPPTSRDSFRI
jgi:hypothetical protein